MCFCRELYPISYVSRGFSGGSLSRTASGRPPSRRAYTSRDALVVVTLLSSWMPLVLV